MIILIFNYCCNAAEQNTTSEEDGQSMSSAKYEMVTLPDYMTLKKLFSTNGLQDLVEKTDIIIRLAGTTLSAGGIEIAKKVMLSDYAKTLKEVKVSSEDAELLFNKIIDILLSDYPVVRENLRLFRVKYKKQLK